MIEKGECEGVKGGGGRAKVKAPSSIANDGGGGESYLAVAVGRPQSPAGSLMRYRLGYRYRSSSAVGAAMISKPARMRSSGSTSRAPPLSALDFSKPVKAERR